MQNPRFIPPLNLDRAMFLYDSPTGNLKTFSTDAKYLDDRHYGSCLNIHGLSTTASSLSTVAPVGIPPTLAPPRPSGTEQSLYFSEKKNQNHSRRIWKLFTRKVKVDNPHFENPPKSATTSDNIAVKKHKSTPDLKESWLNFIGDVNANPCYAPRHGFPAPPSASNAAYFVRTSSERDITDHPTIILIIDDKWDASSADYPLQRVAQTIPVDITDEESSEYSSHPDTDSQYTPQHTPQHHPIRGQRRRAQTSKLSRERWLKKHVHDPNASFLNLDVKTKVKPLRI